MDSSNMGASFGPGSHPTDQARSGLGASRFDPLRRLDAWLDEPDQCRPCHGPIVPKTRLGMFRDWLCYVIVLHWPLRFFMRGPMPLILPYAGTHAYTCTCWPKIRAAIAMEVATAGETATEIGGSVHESPVGNADAP